MKWHSTTNQDFFGSNMECRNDLMWSWVRMSKLGRLASLLALSLAVAGAMVVRAGATEPPDEAPEIWCELYGIERAPADSGVDYRISNLQTMRLNIWVDSRGLRLPELFATGKPEHPDPAAALTVELQGDKSERVPVLLTYRGSSIRPGKYGRLYILTIPLSEDKIRDRYESYKQKLLEMAEPDEKVKLEKLFSRPDFFSSIRRDAEHTPGVYRISCDYSSSKSGYWNGEIRSEIVVAIEFEKSFVERYFELNE